MFCRLPQSDPLNTPLEHLQEEHALDVETSPSRPSTLNSASMFGGASVSATLPSYTKRRSSTEIMRSLPEKLRGHAEHAQALADDALNAFVVINAALQRSSALAEYVGRKDVKARMGEAFRVGMGFGLHTGCGCIQMMRVAKPAP